MPTETLASPGSFNEFVEKTGVDPKQALGEYTTALAGYKSQLPGEGRAITNVEAEDQSNTEENK